MSGKEELVAARFSMGLYEWRSEAEMRAVDSFLRTYRNLSDDVHFDGVTQKDGEKRWWGRIIAAIETDALTGKSG